MAEIVMPVSDIGGREAHVVARVRRQPGDLALDLVLVTAKARNRLMDYLRRVRNHLFKSCRRHSAHVQGRGASETRRT